MPDFKAKVYATVTDAAESKEIEPGEQGQGGRRKLVRTGGW